jgi:hypothetical protein
MDCILTTLAVVADEMDEAACGMAAGQLGKRTV